VGRQRDTAGERGVLVVLDQLDALDDLLIEVVIGDDRGLPSL